MELKNIYAWVGSIVSTLTTCDDLNAEFREGQCGGTANEDQRVIFSLYFAYSVDVATDLAGKLSNCRRSE